MKFIVVLSLLLVIIRVPLAARAQASPAPSSASSDTAGLSILEGVLLPIGGHEKGTGEYSRIDYQGQMLDQRGQPLALGDTTNQFLKTDIAQSDTPGILFDLTHGSGSVTDTRLNALGLNQFGLPALKTAPFDSVVGAFASLGAENRPSVHATAGFERRSYHLLPGIANWIRPGITLDQQFQSRAAGGNTTTGTLTYRAFLGDAHWGRQVVKLPFTTEEVLQLAPTRGMLLDPSTPAKAGTNTVLMHFLTDEAAIFAPAVGGGKVNPPPDVSNPHFDFEVWLRRQSDTYLRVYSLQPDAAFWLESAGWQTFVGKTQGPRFQGLGAAVLTFYRNAGTANAKQLQFRYESGFDRATPGVRRNQLYITLGLLFH